MQKPGDFLRKALENPDGVFALGVSSSFDAILAHKAGHNFLYVGGYAASAINGYPDMGILTQSEMLSHIQRICEAVSAALIVDIDNGYGGVHNVRRTVFDICTKASVAAFHLEDQVIPKRCGHIAGKEILPEEEFLGKLNAAIDMRNEIDPSCLIIARTDAFSSANGKKDEKIGGDIEEAIKRGVAYAKIGADLVWCEFPTSSKESALAFSEGMKQFMPKFGLAFNISPSFLWNENKNHITTAELISMNYKFLFSTYPLLVSAANAVFKESRSFLINDPIRALKGLQRKVNGSPAKSIKKIVGVDNYQEIEMKYDHKAKKRIESTDGFKKPS